jgi:hypothetical protein
MDQILNPQTYNSAATHGINASQIFSDFPTYSSMALDDFYVTSGELRLSRLSSLMLASAGFPAFSRVTSYQISIFSDPSLAQAGLLGDVANLLMSPGSGVTVTQINGGSLGLVDFDVDIQLPSNGSYWLGISAVAEMASSGQFFVRDNGAAGPSAPGGKNGLFVNPGLGFARGKWIAANTDYAYRIIAVPEPSALLLGLCAAPLLCRRRR